MTPCAFDGCDRAARCRGYCDKHYTRWLRHGDPSISHSNRDLPVPDRFWMKVNKTATCWLWTGALAGGGYGVFVPMAAGPRYPAHRWAWEQVHGPTNAEDIDHLCRNRACVNPAHMEPVTHRENIVRGDSPMAINARKTHCQRGHEFSAENTYIRGTGGRACRRCAADYQVRRRAAR